MVETFGVTGEPVRNPAAAEALAKAARRAAEHGPPPVHLWNPPFCGDLDMRIARDGTWYYLGTPIGRMAMVRLFSSIIRKDEDRYVLVTPVEKVGITVDDAPFVAVDFEVSGEGQGQEVTFRTNVEETVTASRTRPIRVEHDPDTGEVSPYILVRANLEALIDRKSFHRLVEMCVHEPHKGQSWFGLWSSGIFFPIIPSKDIVSD
ncbi:MAG: DUF1285 domain-containing protein [Rhodobacteraceae bacterium]|nr:DUF1285 domain-containing protein [Paracoccaceae bacterium]